MGGRLEGKVAVITGAASGIGEGTARRFVTEGARVVIADMQVEAGEALAEALGDAVFLKTDVASEEAVSAAIDLALSRFGRLDCLVNNAGLIGAVGSIRDISAEHWHATMAVLLDGTFFGMKHAARVMMKQGQGGSILTTSSVGGMRGGLGAHPYTTAKHAVIGLARSVASELAPHRIRVNVVAPGTVISAMSAQATSGDYDEITRIATESSPMKQPMLPEDIANAFLYLASDEARHVTGQVLVVDQGVTMAPQVARHHRMEAGFLGSPGPIGRSRASRMVM